MSNVIVTGANGFIGSKMFFKYRAEGYNVQGWDLLKSDISECVDMLDKTAIVNALKAFKPDIIVHCAGSADVAKSFENTQKDFAGNVVVLYNLFLVLQELKLRHVKVVFLSSAAVYGNPIRLPITEDMQVNPLSPYALHKVMCEDIVKYFGTTYDMDVQIARIFSAYGVGLKKQIFWDMHNKLLQTGRLEMFGTGNESRDYIYIDDVVNALFLIATKNSKHLIFNIANGEEITIKEIAEKFARLSNISLDKVLFNGLVREGDPLNWKADISRIKGLGYQKGISVTDGIKKYLKWTGSL